MKLSFDTICLDIETTDVDSRIGSIIQIGAIFLNDEFEEIDSFSTYIFPLDSHRNQKAMAVNKISEDILSHSPTLSEALELFENFVFQKKENKKNRLAAWGAYFDIPFLRAQYKKINRDWPFGHKSIDLKSIATWELSKRNISLNGGVEKALRYLNLEFEGRQHDALADIKNSVRILKKIAAQEKLKTGWNT